MNSCINNLRQIDSAVQTWALDNKQPSSANPGYTDISSYLKNQVVCPSGGTAFSDSYTLNGVTNKPTCNSTGGGSANGHVMATDSSS